MSNKETFDKFINIAIQLSEGNKRFKNITFSVDELMYIQKVLLSYYWIAGYEHAKIFHNKDIIEKAIKDNEFYKTCYFEGTTEYQNLIRDVKELSGLQPGEKLVKKHNIDNTFRTIKVYDVYLPIIDKSTGLKQINKYIKISNIDKEVAQVYNNSNYYDCFDGLYHGTLDSRTAAKLNFDHNKIEKVGEEYHYNTNNNDGITVCLNGGKSVVYSFDTRYNPFETGHVKIIDNLGNVSELPDSEYINFVKKLRLAAAHTSRQGSYSNGSACGAKFIDIGGGKTSLISNRWFENFSLLNFSVGAQQTKSFDLIYLPPLVNPINSEEACNNYLDSLICYNLTFEKPVNTKMIMDYVWDNINSVSKALNFDEIKSIIENKFASKLGITNITQIDYNADLLKIRLGKDKQFRNIVGNKKENKKLQKNLIEAMYYEVYDKITRPIKGSGKIEPIRIYSAYLVEVAVRLLPYIQTLASHISPVESMNQYSSEIYLFLCSFLTYKNLVYNNFLEDIEANQLYRYSGEVTPLQSALSAMDMSIFKMRVNGKDVSLNNLPEKLTVLRHLRNMVSHDNMFVQFNRSNGIKESQIVFGNAGEQIQIKVKIEDFIKFISSDIFVNYVSSGEQDWTIDGMKVDMLYNLLASQFSQAKNNVIKQINGKTCVTAGKRERTENNTGTGQEEDQTSAQLVDNYDSN